MCCVPFVHCEMRRETLQFRFVSVRPAVTAAAGGCIAAAGGGAAVVFAEEK